MRKTNNLNDYLLTRLEEIGVSIDEITVPTLKYSSSKQKNVHTNSKLLDKDSDNNITIKYHYLDGNVVFLPALLTTIFRDTQGNRSEKRTNNKNVIIINKSCTIVN